MTNINWKKTGIPTDKMNNSMSQDLTQQTGQSTGATIKEIGSFETNLGPGPQGNMMGSSVDSGANSAIDSAYRFAGPDAVVQTRPKMEAIEAVEGFGEADVGSKIIGAANGVNVSGS